MKKIASNLLIVSTQLVVGGLFLFMLFSNGVEDNKVVVVKNNNLNKMADSVSELFVADQLENVVASDTKEVNLMDEEEAAKKRAEEEAKKKAEEEAARKKAEEEEAARKRAEEEAARKKAEEEAASRAVISSNQSVAALQEYARNLVINSYGWSNDDFVALVNLWNKESGWNVTCYNSYSGAYGIPQSLPGSKMASEGSDWEYNGETQIRWGLNYIRDRYGSPSGAWSHFLSTNWY